jgi:RNA polymerase sigma-70 factor (ECF subfamily)
MLESHDLEIPTWEEIVRSHSTRVFRHAYRLSGNRADAEDLTQEVFARVYRSRDTYRTGTFEGWLHRITTNLFVDQVRRRGKILLSPLTDAAESRSNGAEEPERMLLDELFDDDVEAALAALAPEYREPVVLCDVQGLSYEEVGQALDLKPGTVRSRIHRGRAQLRKALAHRAPRSGRTASRASGRGPSGPRPAPCPAG